METDLINPIIEAVAIEKDGEEKAEVVVVEQENSPEMTKDSSTEVDISGSKEINKTEAEIDGEPEETLVVDSHEDLAELNLAHKYEEIAVINENDDSIKKTENIVSADEATNEALIDPTAGTGYFKWDCLQFVPI